MLLKTEIWINKIKKKPENQIKTNIKFENCE